MATKGNNQKYDRETIVCLKNLCHQAGLSATRQKQLLEFLDGPKAKEERKKFASAKKFFCSTSAKSPSATSLDRAPSARCDLGLMPRLRKREDIEKRGDYQRDERPLLKTRLLDDHEKASLAFHMAYGKPLPDAALVMKNAIETRRKEAQKKTRSVDRNERFSELVRELEDRRQFVVEVRRHGGNAASVATYERQMKGEMAEKLMEMERMLRDV